MHRNKNCFVLEWRRSRNEFRLARSNSTKVHSRDLFTTRCSRGCSNNFAHSSEHFIKLPQSLFAKKIFFTAMLINSGTLERERERKSESLSVRRRKVWNVFLSLNLDWKKRFSSGHVCMWFDFNNFSLVQLNPHKRLFLNLTTICWARNFKIYSLDYRQFSALTREKTDQSSLDEKIRGRSRQADFNCTNV